MAFKIFRDDDAVAIVVEAPLGAYFFNALQAVEGAQPDGVTIINLSKRQGSSEAVDGYLEFNEVNFSEFVDENDQPYGVDATTTVNALNAVFVNSGSTGDVPVITSPTSINSVEGQTINYELTATNGVGYEYNNLPAGLVNQEGNIRKIVGSLSAGVYTPTMTATNYFGSDTETLTINVANPPFANTYSVNFNTFEYLNATANSSNPLYRPTNGTGASDAWSISLYFKPGSSNNSEQTIVMFGGSDQNNEGRVHLWYNGQSNNDKLVLRYGTNFNYLQFQTPNVSLPAGSWSHILVTYDGGTTGVASGSISNYYSRFKIYIDGVLQTTSNSNSNFGFAGEIVSDFFRVGRNGNVLDYMRNNCRVDELALWASDQSSNIAAIYNSGTPFDLSSLGTPPNHWWRMGDGDTFPALQDSQGSLNFTMTNMNAGDIVNDVP